MNEARAFLLRHKQWVVFIAVTVGGFFVTSTLVAPAGGPAPPDRIVDAGRAGRGAAEVSSKGFEGSPDSLTGGDGPSSDTSPMDVAREGFRAYAVPVHELAGLPPDLASGTGLELWVAWERPVTRGPRVQRLLKTAAFDRIAPPMTPEGSPVAILSIPRDKMADVVFADRWGALSVATY